MDPNEPTVTDLSDSGDSNSSTGSCHSEVLTSFQPYRRIDAKVDNEVSSIAPVRFADGNEMPIALDKPKDYAIHRNEIYSESSSTDEPSASIFRGDSKDQLPVQKEAMYSFCREIREMRQKNLHAALERTSSLTTTNCNKDFEMIKTYGLPLDRVKDFGFASRLALDRLRAAPIHGESTPTTIEADDLKSLSQPQSRTTNQAEAMAFERLRHSHPLFQQSIASDSHFSSQSHAPVQLGPPHSHHHHHHHHHQQQQHAITQITQMQQIGSAHQQQHHQQQPKSFTIDAILGLRATAQREKHQRYHPYKKQQGQENTSKCLSTSSCSNGNNGDNGNRSGGKLKRVRTIFTAEQLERLEDEFTRQQYMVGPERLYLAHALRLTEAQVKVWFQNRRIKWRKHNHEQTSQRLHELHQRSMSEREDSNENVAEW